MASLDNPMETLRRITGGMVATPTVVIGDEAKVGFDPAWIQERLGTAETDSADAAN